MSEKCRNNNNSDNPLTSCRTDGGNKRELRSKTGEKYLIEEM